MQGLQRVTKSLLQEHYYLTPYDECYYLFDYKPGAGFEDNVVNQFIGNYKSKSSPGGNRYLYSRMSALNQVRLILSACLPDVFDLNEITLVPVPGSKTKSSVEYDDRNLRVLGLMQHLGLSVQELLHTQKDTLPVHKSVRRPSLSELKSNLAVDAEKCRDVKRKIVLFDDMLTSGAHYTACRELLEEVLPEADIAAVFIARRSLNWQPLEIAEYN